MINRDMKILNDLFTLARDIEPVASSRLAAALVYKNRIVSYGFNRDKTHTFQAKFAKNEDAIYWHAETNVIYNALKLVDETNLRKMTLYVARAKYAVPNSNEWRWGNSKPCEGCMSCITKFGIKKIVYTQDNIGHYGIYELRRI